MAQKIIALKPIKETTEDYDAIEKEIKRVFLEEIYWPLMREFGEKKQLTNAQDSLLKALQTGRVQYSRGSFSSKNNRFNSAVSKDLYDLGAKWDTKSFTFKMPIKQLPNDIRLAISQSAVKFEEKLRKADEHLAKILPDEIAAKIKTSKYFDKTIFKTEQQLKKSMKAITVTPKLTVEQSKRLSDEWQNNMNIWIKDFTEKQIKDLRSDISKSVFAGNRYDSMIKTIQKSYGVTENKAKFLARQETSLAITKFKEIRYQDAGVNEYKWRSVTGSPAHPVRPMHKELDRRSRAGETFRFDDPPMDDPNGSHHNPGQNFGCRCVAVPIVRFYKKT